MLDCEAVKLWRDTFRLNLSASWKRDVELTVKDLGLWKEVLIYWKKNRRHPGIKGLLDEYERQYEIQQERNRVHCAKGVPERSAVRVPELRMPLLLERSRGWQG